MPEFRLTGWLRPASTVIALAGLLALSACGGGGGSINNPNLLIPVPPPPGLFVNPSTVTVYSGIPATLTITGGVPPYQAFSTNPTVLPVPLAVAGNTIVLIAASIDPNSGGVAAAVTVQDSVGQTDRTDVSVQGAPLLNTLTILPAGGDCGANVCSAQTASVSVTALGPAGAPLPNRQIRFDVVYGPFGITTSNPIVPVAQTLTVVTDSAGVAQVQVRANVDAATQFAQIRATDVATGQQSSGNFVVQNNTVAGQSPITVVPTDATVTAFFRGECTSGFRVDYYIYGGTPPYRVSSTFPDGIQLVNTVVVQNGGFFGAITNGTCLNPVVFTIVDSAGKQVTTLLRNLEGSNTRPAPTPASPLAISPTTVTNNACTGRTFRFVITGGTAPYSVTSSSPTAVVTPNPVATSGGFVDVSGLLTGSLTTTVVAVDVGSPQQTVSATIACP